MSTNSIITIAVTIVLLVALMWLNDKFLVPWQAKRQVKRLLDDVKSGKLPKPRDFTHKINFDDQGFCVSSLKQAATSSPRLAWAEIQTVQVFKRDLLTVDMVCMLLAKPDGTGIELDEDLAGWLDFIRALPRYLPGCQPFEKWHWEVTVPAFETNLTEIYRRQTVADSRSHKLVLA